MSTTDTELDAIMEFDHVVTVHKDGTVTDGPDGIYAPTLQDGELDSADWELMAGYTGQYGYNGPIMHASEFIGGGLARDILAAPGMYVSLVAYCELAPDINNEDDSIEGWAIARYIGA